MPTWVEHTGILVAGVVVLGVGGEWLVRGAARLARVLGVSALVVGLTVVAFGTSAPEAAVTVFAAARGVTELAVGNVVGSNIANMLLILGLAAVISPLAVSRGLIRIDGPMMVGSAAAFVVLAWQFGEVARWAGAVFVVGLVAYTLFTYFASRRNPLTEWHDEPLEGRQGRVWYNAVLVLLGVGGLVGGARLIVDGATGLATAIGISDRVIGLTIVAVGTSLPELATTIVAARHKQPDMALGNVIGSNIFNVLFVAGTASLVRPLAVHADIARFDGPLMLVICAASYVIIWSGRRVTRLEGGTLLAGYVAYLIWTGWQAA
jgi:cation:H+ antiporter